jgi:hypothetical protein
MPGGGGASALNSALAAAVRASGVCTQPTWATAAYPNAQITDPYLGTTLTAALPGYVSGGGSIDLLLFCCFSH